MWFTKPYPVGGTIASNLVEHQVGAFNEEAFVHWAKQPDNLFAVPALGSDSGLHPTQKPLRLMQMLIETVTCPGQTVCDPFCGSGTTLIAAMRSERKYLGFEINPEYFQTAQQRIAQEESKLVLFENI